MTTESMQQDFEALKRTITSWGERQRIQRRRRRICLWGTGAITVLQIAQAAFLVIIGRSPFQGVGFVMAGLSLITILLFLWLDRDAKRSEKAPNLHQAIEAFYVKHPGAKED